VCFSLRIWQNIFKLVYATSSYGTADSKSAKGTSGPHAHGANGNTENGLNGTNSYAATTPKSGMFIN
jgi:hypothetical protein